MVDKAPDFDLEFSEITPPVVPDPKPAPVVAVIGEPVVPEKYKGKSVSDLIDMHQNAERKISQQGSDLAEQRRLSDQILGLQKDNAMIKVDKPKVTTEDLLTDPDSALTRAIDNSKVAERQLEDRNRLEAIEKGIGQREFEGNYPDFMRDVQNPEFQTWVGTNKARVKLLVDLNNNYNFESGTSLWEMWNERNQPSSQDNTDTTVVSRRETIRQASTVRGGPTDGSRKPVFSRAKLLELQEKAIHGDPVARLKWNDPEFQKEYHEAYAEKRVK